MSYLNVLRGEYLVQEVSQLRPDSKDSRFLLGFVLGFGATAVALSVWTLSLLTVWDWFHTDDASFSRLPLSIPLWLAILITAAVPFFVSHFGVCLWKRRFR